MVVTYAVATPVAIVDLPYRQAICTPQIGSNLGCSILTTAAYHYKLTEDQEVRITRHKIV